MLHRTRSAASFAFVPLVALVLASSASAQLKLPRRPAEATPGRGTVAPHRVCTVCSARNYSNAPSGRTDTEGRELAWCDTCKRDTAQTWPSGAGGSGEVGITTLPRDGDLKLPRRPLDAPPAADPVQGPVQPTASAPADPAVAGRAPSTPPVGATPGSIAPAAARILADVAKLDSADGGAAQRAVESLLALREEGLAAARSALFEERPATIAVAARVLLRGGVSTDGDLVVRRLRAKLPGGAGPPLLRAVVEEDPIRATNELFAALLDHAQPTLRTAASRELRAHLEPESIDLLGAPLQSQRSETRALALEIAAALPGERATAAILTRLDDPNARVASAAVSALRARNDAGLDQELLRRAFLGRWVLRPQAYALLAILEREDSGLRPILGDEHVEPLLASMASIDPFLSGTCAAALAGIGFRSNRADVSNWLDSEVVDRLVIAVSGKYFHDDHSSLIGPAVRRLRLVTAETIAQDGAAWVDWWVRAREGFNARRAALTIPPGDEGAIRFSAVAPEIDLDVELHGPDAVERPANAPRRRETIVLGSAQAAELAAALAREGVLSPSRMPGTYASEGREDRSLEIEVRGRSKSFVVGPRAKTPWFEALISLAASLRERNRWQVLVGSGVSDAERTKFDEETRWWAAAHTAEERSTRLAQLSLDALAGNSVTRRAAALDELDAASAAGRLPMESFTQLVAALRREANSGARARRLVDLAIAAGAGSDRLLPAAVAQRLLDATLETFGAGASELPARILASSERVYVRRLAADTNEVLRLASAEALGRSPDEEDALVLVALLTDAAPRVYAAAAEALGRAKVETARADLLARARIGTPASRAVALRAAGSLGGPNVLDALVLGLSDTDLDVRRAAVVGLGRLGDPTSATILVNMLHSAGDAPLADVARSALVGLGPAAIPALRRTAEGTDPRSRREAALVLAKLLSPDAVPPLLAIVTQDPLDKHAANELAILSCFEPRAGVANPSDAWWEWWEGVRHDDALVWFRAGVERLSIPQPPEGALEGAGTLDGRRFLLTLVDREETWLAERAWREYARLAGTPTADMPARGLARSNWIRERRAELEASGSQR